MFRHGEELYLIARTDPDGPYDMGFDNLSFNQQRAAYLAAFSLRSHGTVRAALCIVILFYFNFSIFFFLKLSKGLWRVDKSTMTLQFIATLPGCGDTAFPSIVR